MTDPLESERRPEADVPETDIDALFAADEVQPAIGSPVREPDFEDLTLADVVARLIRAPRETWRLVAHVAQTPISHEKEDRGPARPVFLPPIERAPSIAVESAAAIFPVRLAIRLSLHLVALVIALWGNRILATAPVRIESEALDKGAPFLLIALVVWLGAEVYADWHALVRPPAAKPANRGFDRDESPGSISILDDDLPAGLDQPSLDRVYTVRVVLLLTGLVLSIVAWQGTLNNRFTTHGFLAWIASAVLCSAALTSLDWSPISSLRTLVGKVRGFFVRGNGTLYALVAIMALGAVFRLTDLAGLPPEMTSDHVEKLLDSQRVLDGNPQVFFPNNGGREPFQMYAMALFSQLPGMGMNFQTLKLLAVVESLLTIPVLWWMGRELVGDEDQRLGNIAGLILAALVAASYWHTAITRLALRIVLTPLVAALEVIFLTRALRNNRRNDFIMAGLVLGFGLYTYQAIRMLPLVVLVGVGLALVFRSQALTNKRSWGFEAVRYVENLAVLVIVAFICFVPLAGFWQQYPEDFWRRTQGRLLGDDVIQETDAQGNLVYRDATVQDKLDALKRNLPVLASNIRNAVLMYNWKGDVAWISAAPNYPAMDVITGSLLVVGLGAWLARMARRRDPADWLIPVMLFIMLLPSALSIAYPIENPSATRTSGTLPEAYLLAAFPLALIVREMLVISPGRGGKVASTALVAILVLIAYNLNGNLYFGWSTTDPEQSYRGSYLVSSLPYSQAGQILHGFAESDGGYGNAFMIAYPYWWDHRAVGIEGGAIDWPNGILKAEDVPEFLADAYLRKGHYQLDPSKDFLFFYSQDDKEADRLLKEWFPSGRSRRVESYQGQAYEDFMVYRVPALGEADFVTFIKSYRLRQTGSE